MKNKIIKIVYALMLLFTVILIGCDEEYAVTFNAQGGTNASGEIVENQNVIYGAKIIEPNNMVKEYQIFGGWYKEAECLNLWDFDNDEVTSNMTLYAKWVNNLSFIFKYDENVTECTVMDSNLDYLGTDIYIPAYYMGKPIIGIGYNAFNNRKKLRSVTISNGPKFIGNSSFKDCISLVKFNMPISVKNIELRAFEGCLALSDIKLSDNIKIIEDFSFKNCVSLSHLILPSNTLTIGFSAFRGCSNLGSIRIPVGVSDIRGSAFADCESLTAIDVDPQNLNYTSIDGILFEKSMNSIVSFPAGKMVNTYDIPSTVTSIKEGAFAGAKLLTEIKIPQSVSVIAPITFQNCLSLIYVDIPSNVTKIEDQAFGNCISLKSITLPGNLTFLSSAFTGCISLGSINLPSKVETLHSPFIGCSSLTVINVDPDSPYYSSIGGVLYNKPVTSLVLYPSGRSTENFIFPSSVNTIGDAAFAFNTKIESLFIPEYVNIIEADAFSYCTSLTKVVLECVRYVGFRAFAGCSSAWIYTCRSYEGNFDTFWNPDNQPVVNSCGE